MEKSIRTQILKSIFAIALTAIVIACTQAAEAKEAHYPAAQGTLKVYEKIKLHQNFSYNPYDNQTLYAGVYPAWGQLTMDQSKVTLTLKENLGYTSYDFQLPYSVELFRSVITGDFIIPSEISGQPYDLVGDVQHKVKHGKTYNYTQACYRPGVHGGMAMGSQTLKFQVITKQIDVDADLMDGFVTVAKLEAHNATQKKVLVGKSACQ